MPIVILHRHRNKKLSLQKKDWVFFTSPFTAFHRRLIVKRIQADFLAYGSSYSLPLPTLRVAQGSGSGKFRPRSQRRGRPRLSRGSLFGFRPPEY